MSVSPCVNMAVPPAPKPHKHRSFTVEFKVGVVEWVERHSSSVRGASLHFGLDRKVIRSWIKQKQALREALQLRGAETKKLHGGRDPTSFELDRQVLEYTQKVKGHHCHSLNPAKLKDKQLQQIAREYAARLGVNGFKASVSWLRGWKGRCKQGQEGGRNRKGKDGVPGTGTSPPSPHTVSSNLSTLTEQDKRGVACCLGNQGVSKDEGICDAQQTNLASAMPIAHSYQQELHSGTPEHNYSSSPVSHNHVTTPTPECTTPSCLQVHMEELLGGVALLRSHDQEQKLDLSALEEEVGAAVGEVPHQLHQSVLTIPGLVLDDAHHPNCHAPSSLLEGEDPVMSLFNHRSFTDHFPFLPPSLFNSNWCPPYESPRFSSSTMDSLIQTTPHFNSEGGLGQPKVKSKGRLDVGVSRYHTRSKAQALALALATANQATSAYPVATAAHGTSSGWPPTPTSSPSPSPLDTLYSPTRQPGGGGGVALLSPPTPSTEGVVNSPPGGLLANRRFQPIFPDEPEIVFHEIQLGPLHTTPGHGP